jgi:hypothetical protein
VLSTLNTAATTCTPDTVAHCKQAFVHTTNKQQIIAVHTLTAGAWSARHNTPLTEGGTAQHDQPSCTPPEQKPQTTVRHATPIELVQHHPFGEQRGSNSPACMMCSFPAVATRTRATADITCQSVVVLCQPTALSEKPLCHPPLRMQCMNKSRPCRRPSHSEHCWSGSACNDNTALPVRLPSPATSTHGSRPAQMAA